MAVALVIVLFSPFSQGDDQGAEGADYLIPRTSPEDFPVIKIPTPQTPVVFYHLRKCGGTSLRRVLYSSAKEAGVLDASIHIPCFPNRSPCDIYDIQSDYGETQSIALLGGHFFWGSQERLLPFKFQSPAVQGESDYSPPRNIPWQCITLIRDPFERVISCFYYRLYKRIGKLLHELHPEVLRWILLRERDDHGHTCSNEMLRIFTGMIEEWTINVPGDWSVGVLSHLFARAANNMGRCIILDLDNMDENVELLHYWSPWIDMSQIDHSNANRRKPEESLPPQIMEVIRETNAAEMRMYELAKQFRATQLEYVRGAAG